MKEISSNVAAVLLAGGRGSRTGLKKENKTTLPLADKPMVAHTVENLREAGFYHICVVIGFAGESVKKVLGDSVVYMVQEEPEGTGHALKVGMGGVPREVTEVFSLYGDDSAFYPPELYLELLNVHKSKEVVVTLFTINKEDPTGLGRIIRDGNGDVVAIVEEKNATDVEREIKEINTGLYCFDRQFLDEALREIKRNEISGEYYLTDIVEIAKEKGKKIAAFHSEDSNVWYGVNTLDQLQEANEAMLRRNQLSQDKTNNL